MIATTTWWSFPARVAMAFAELGWHVEAVCGRGDPLTQTSVVRRCHRYSALRPLAGLSASITHAAPDLVVPCDDRAVSHLQALHRRLAASGGGPHAALIARSLGATSVPGRAAFIDMARRIGVRAPLTRAVRDRAELRRALDEIALPAVLKVDDTWGSEGVVVVETVADAERAFAQKSRRFTALKALKRLVANRDPFWLLPSLHATRPRVNIQAMVPGRPANCVIACWQGEMLAIIQVDVVRMQHDMGPAAVVRLADRPDIAVAATRIVAELGLSGFCGLDFMIEEETGAAHLIEMNPRMTPLGHLALGPGRDPVAALAARAGGKGITSRPAVTSADTIAYFPQAWLRDPGSPDLSSGYHDVPWSEPGLVRELVLQPYRQRSWLARLLRRSRARPAATPDAKQAAAPSAASRAVSG